MILRNKPKSLLSSADVSEREKKRWADALQVTKINILLCMSGTHEWITLGVDCQSVGMLVVPIVKWV